MICRRCLSRLAHRAQSTVSSRSYTTTTPRLAEPVTSQTTTASNPRPNGAPAATSTSAAQPFSTPETPATDRHVNLPIEPNQSKQPAAVQSSVPAGTVLKGLNFMKNKQDPIAMEDHEYPAWLWGALAESKEKSAKDDLEGDLFAKSKKQRRRAAKALRRQQLLNPDMMEPKVPLYEQSIDLPAGDGSLEGNKSALDARGELTHAMRQQRRAKIKEGNFLKAMG
ncbi:uncharacterized protein LTR77_001196 [Saxophila tyrrhenica]|uniref:Large ribosomal subunit protein mL54 n=1 Tax=Saxophila tyrrhenica TaxID=1690608 RepID=A0AAV9PMX0_9PEZI|nr:hypothetical protein LTR77_001196 [Saxophila tyrrhenica]